MKFNNIKVSRKLKNEPCTKWHFCMMISLSVFLQSEGPDQCSQPEDLVSWCLIIYSVCVSSKDTGIICILYNAELFYSHREWPRWQTAGGIQCWFCRHSLKRVQPALSSLPTTPTVWEWVHQVQPATCLCLSWGQITAELYSHKVSLWVQEERHHSATIVYSTVMYRYLLYVQRDNWNNEPGRCLVSNHNGIPQFQVCVHTSSLSISLMSAARLYVCGRIWWSWMSFTSFLNFPAIPPCIWLCVTLFWPPGTKTARYTADISKHGVFFMFSLFRFWTMFFCL